MEGGQAQGPNEFQSSSPHPSAAPPSAPRTFTVILHSRTTLSTICRRIGNVIEASLPDAIVGTRHIPEEHNVQTYDVTEPDGSPIHGNNPTMREHSRHPCIGLLSRFVLPVSALVLMNIFLFYVYLFANQWCSNELLIFTCLGVFVLLRPDWKSDETMSLSMDSEELTVHEEGFFSKQKTIPLSDIRYFRAHCIRSEGGLAEMLLVYIEIITVHGTLLVGESAQQVDYSGAVRELNNYFRFWREQGAIGEPWKPLYETLMESTNMTVRVSEALVLGRGIEWAQSPRLHFVTLNRSSFSCTFASRVWTWHLPLGFDFTLWRDKWTFCNNSRRSRHNWYCSGAVVNLRHYSSPKIHGPYCSDSSRYTEEEILKCMRHNDYSIWFVRKPDNSVPTEETDLVCSERMLVFGGLTEAEVLLVARRLVLHFPELISGPSEELQSVV